MAQRRVFRLLILVIFLVLAGILAFSVGRRRDDFSLTFVRYEGPTFAVFEITNLSRTAIFYSFYHIDPLQPYDILPPGDATVEKVYAPDYSTNVMALSYRQPGGTGYEDLRMALRRWTGLKIGVPDTRSIKVVALPPRDLPADAASEEK